MVIITSSAFKHGVASCVSAAGKQTFLVLGLELFLHFHDLAGIFTGVTQQKLLCFVFMMRRHLFPQVSSLG